MNVTNERPSVESDEETFIDQHGRSLHLVGADVLHERERPTLRCLMALPDSCTRAIDACRRGSISPIYPPGARRIRKAFIVIAWRPSPAIC
jgi:hypothetical protein